MLRLNGYNTAAFGKWHETAPWEVSVSGALRPLAHHGALLADDVPATR
jgi:arylsulfatase A-like enzyme